MNKSNNYNPADLPTINQLKNWFAVMQKCCEEDFLKESPMMKSITGPQSDKAEQPYMEEIVELEAYIEKLKGEINDLKVALGDVQNEIRTVEYINKLKDIKSQNKNYPCKYLFNDNCDYCDNHDCPNYRRNSPLGRP